MSKNKKVVLTGGGTAGHVVPNLAFADLLQNKGYECRYIGSSGMERELVLEKDLPFHTIMTGKLRREWSLKNLWMPFQVAIGFFQSLWVLFTMRPDFVFSKGGYVSVPVCLAAWLLRIPSYSHESDLSPGLANKILQKFTKKFFYSFPQSRKYFSASSECVGSPIRPAIFDAKPAQGLGFLGWKKEGNPILFVVGGSLGSVKLNKAIKDSFEQLATQFRVVHVTGEGKGLELSHPNYISFPYLRKEYADVLAASDFVLARAGANSIFEFLALKKPMLLMPLVAGSRGDQVENAASFKERGWAHALDESKVDSAALMQGLLLLQSDADKMLGKQSEAVQTDALSLIWQSIARDQGLHELS